MDERDREIDAPRSLASHLSVASLRINQSLDFDDVLQGVLESIRLLTNADSSAMILVDDEGAVQELLITGLTPTEAEQHLSAPQGREVLEALTSTTEPVRIPDLMEHLQARGLTEWRPVRPADSVTLMAVPLLHQGVYSGHVFVGNKAGGEQFTEADEEILVMFAAQAALVIANARLHQKEQQARASVDFMAEMSPVGVVIMDARTGATSWLNLEASRILDSLCDKNRPWRERLGEAICLQPDGAEVSLKELPLAKALKAGEAVRGEEVALRAPDGRIVRLLVSAIPIRSEDGRLQWFLATLQDLAPLEQQEWLRAEFLAMVSHELRAPLAAIKGSVTTLLESANELGPVEMAQFHSIIRDQSDQMRFLISDLLDVAHIETGTLPVDPAPADVHTLVEEARARFLNANACHALEVELEEGLPPVMADRRRILQVLGNLFSNAARASPDGSPILVTAVREGDQVAVSVADKGKGVSSERLPELFQKYSREPHTHGSGLGLAICKGIVEAHGGRIWAESDGLDLGAHFTFTLPAVEAAAAAADSDSLQSPQSRLATPRPVRVLAVDDDPHTLRYVRDILAREGYKAIATSDPADVDRLIAWEKPHLVLLDLILPGSDGIELMNAIRRAADIPIIFMSAYGQDETVARALDMGAADYLVKPFSPTELAARIRSALRRRPEPLADEPTAPYDAAGLGIDYIRRRVTVDGRVVDLTATEYATLYELAIHAPRVLTHNVLLQRVWGPERVGESWLLRDIVKRLRRKLGDDAANPKYIFTEPRVGYWMTTADDI